MIAAASVRVSPTTPHLDMEAVRRVVFYFAVACLVVAPYSRDPLALAAGAAVPWLVATILAKPQIPVVIFYFLLTNWIQVVARLGVSWNDSESLGDGLWGHDLTRAYWYSLASIIVLALGVRVGFAGLPTPQGDPREQAQTWRLSHVFLLYLLTFVFSVLVNRVAPMTGGLSQALLATASIRLVTLFLLFVTAIQSPNGTKFIAFAMVIEIGIGFTGLFSDFKTGFIVLGIAAVVARPPLRLRMIVVAVASTLVFVALLLFWTGIKSEYRLISSGYSNTQHVSAPLEERMDWLVGKILSPTEQDWSSNADLLLRRIAYIDFFAATMSAEDSSPDSRSFGNWTDLIRHVSRPRLLFPEKGIVDDTDVLERLARIDSGDDRGGTSISVGYLAENYADFRFPMMLLPLLGLGIFAAIGVRYFLTRPAGWLTGEGFALAFVLSFSFGTSVTLIKFVATGIVHFVMLALIVKFVWRPHWLR